MKNRNVTTQEIEQLRCFVRKHYVEFYDVELELVDHLANGIEEQWLADVELPFEEALQREFKKFGVFGFTGLVEERQAALSKSYYRMTLKALVAYLSLPKLLLTLTLFVGLYTLGIQVEQVLIVYALIFGTIFFYMVVSGLVQIQKIKKRQRATKKKWLVESVGGQFYGLPLGVVLINGFHLINAFTSYSAMVVSKTLVVLISLFLTFLVLLLVVSEQVVRPFIKEQIDETITRYRWN